MFHLNMLVIALFTLGVSFKHVSCLVCNLDQLDLRPILFWISEIRTIRKTILDFSFQRGANIFLKIQAVETENE